jgi:preprotein translocase subunit YajC
MFSLGLPLLMGQGASTGGEGGASGASGGLFSGGIMSFLPFILIIAVFYFLIIRPQNKKQKETKKMLEALKKGDKVVTIGGIHGTIATVRETSVVLRVDDNTKIEFSRSAIGSVTDVAKAEASSDDKDDKSDYEVKEIK